MSYTSDRKAMSVRFSARWIDNLYAHLRIFDLVFGWIPYS